MNVQEFDYSVDLLQTLIWQQNNAKNFEALLTLKQEWYNTYQTEFWQSWYRDVFDLRTANDFGLAVWSIILGLPLFIDLLPNDRVTWGFGSFHANFDNGNFVEYSNNIVLSTEEKRIALRLRYFQLTSRLDVPSINKFLKYLFLDDYGIIFCYDNLDMSIRYTYYFDISFRLLEALRQYDLLPRPEGVLVNLIDGNYPAWGFDEYHNNFDNGNFYPS